MTINQQERSVEELRDMMRLIPNGMVIHKDDLEEIFSQEEKDV